MARKKILDKLSIYIPQEYPTCFGAAESNESPVIAPPGLFPGFTYLSKGAIQGLERDSSPSFSLVNKAAFS
ncbi:hypothetical protein KAX17_14775 [Candidatus Bipolaricaulota bacterium]|nr:hypothetical protein [Candidatus Bipolaricaulota bacterium]